MWTFEAEMISFLGCCIRKHIEQKKKKRPCNWPVNAFNAHYRVRRSNGTELRDTYPLHQRSHGDVKELCVRFW